MRKFLLNHFVKNLGCHVIANLGFPLLLHRTLLPNQLTIIMYHAVIRTPLEVYEQCFLSEASFRNQVSYLQTHFEVIPLSKAVERMKGGKILRPTAVITFDDGFQNNSDIAFPILQQAGLPATIFLTTGLVNTSDTLWYCRLNRALASSQMDYFEWDGFRFDLSNREAKARTAAAIQARLKKFAHSHLMAELRKIVSELGEEPDSPIDAGSPYRMLSRQAITEMVSSGIIEFGAHTHTHAILSRLPKQEQYDEIERSVAAIKELTGRSCELFAYPNGGVEDYDADTIAALEKCGVHTSVTTLVGANNGHTSAMELRRYGVEANWDMAYFQLLVHHLIAQARGLV